jgi:hypothetical protein
MWKETVIASYEALPRHLPTWSKEYHSLDNWCSGQDLNSGTPDYEAEGITARERLWQLWVLIQHNGEDLLTFQHEFAYGWNYRYVHVEAVWQFSSVKTLSVPYRWKYVYVEAIWRHLSRHWASLRGESMYTLRPSDVICQDTEGLL